jgi:hypothetical protein
MSDLSCDVRHTRTAELGQFRASRADWISQDIRLQVGQFGHSGSNRTCTHGESYRIMLLVGNLARVESARKSIELACETRHTFTMLLASNFMRLCYS